MKSLKHITEGLFDADDSLDNFGKEAFIESCFKSSDRIEISIDGDELNLSTDWGARITISNLDLLKKAGVKIINSSSYLAIEDQKIIKGFDFNYTDDEFDGYGLVVKNTRKLDNVTINCNVNFNCFGPIELSHCNVKTDSREFKAVDFLEVDDIKSNGTVIDTNLVHIRWNDKCNNAHNLERFVSEWWNNWPDMDHLRDWYGRKKIDEVFKIPRQWKVKAYSIKNYEWGGRAELYVIDKSVYPRLDSDRKKLVVQTEDGWYLYLWNGYSENFDDLAMP